MPAGDSEVEPGAERHRRRERGVAEVLRHRRRVDDLAGVEHVARVEQVLDRPHGLVELIAEDLAVELAAGQAVAVLAGVDAAELAHEVLDLLGDGAHPDDLVGSAEVDERPDVQAADRAVTVEAGAHLVLVEDLGEPGGVGGESLRRDGGVLDERQRPVRPLAGGHQQPEAGLADLEQRALLRRGHQTQGVVPVAVGVPEVDQRVEPLRDVVEVVAGERDEQQGRRVTDQAVAQVGVLDLAAGQVENGLVHQLDLGGVARQRVGGGLDRLLRGVEVPHREDRVLRFGHQVDHDLGGDRQRALGADDELREVERGAVDHPVEAVAAGAAPERREPVRDGGPVRLDDLR